MLLDVHETFTRALGSHQAGKFAQAEGLYRNVLWVDPQHKQSLRLLGVVLLAQRKPAEALDPVMRTLQTEETAEAKALFVQCIKELQPRRRRDDVRNLLAQALSEGWTRPGDLARVSAGYVRLEPAVKEALEEVSVAWPRRIGARDLSWAGLGAIVADPLLVTLLAATPIADVALEQLLSEIRNVLLEIAAGTAVPGVREKSLLRFACALARQCFLNDYVYSSDDEEGARAQRLRSQLAEALRNDAAIPPLWPVVAGTYAPLHEVPGAERLLQKP